MYLIASDGTLDTRVLQMFRILDDRKKLRQLVPLPALPRVAVQGYLLLRIHEARKLGSYIVLD